MSDACFIADLGPATSGDQPLAVGDLVEITGSEAHHAAVVRRIEVGESVLVTNGQGLAVRGPVVGVAKRCVQVRVAQTLRSAEHAHRWVAVQALAKGDRADRAVETLTEMGVDEIIAWQADRCVAKWDGKKAPKAVAKWQAAADSAAKQSRRARTQYQKIHLFHGGGIKRRAKGHKFCDFSTCTPPPAWLFTLPQLGRGQVVRHRFLVPCTVGSNPTAPAISGRSPPRRETGSPVVPQ